MVDERQNISYRSRVLHQARLWSNGHSMHNHKDDECTPDFSCCHPEMFNKCKADRVNFYLQLQIRVGSIQ